MRFPARIAPGTEGGKRLRRGARLGPDNAPAECLAQLQERAAGGGIGAGHLDRLRDGRF